MLSGENGIIKRAVEARKKTEYAQEKDFNVFKEYEEKLNNYESSRIISLFMWDPESAKMAQLQSTIDYLKLNTIYASFDYKDGINAYKEEALIQICERNNIDLYVLDGENDWYQNDKKKNIKELIDAVYAYNNSTTNVKIKGISLDIEFYLSDEYKSAIKTEKQKIFGSYVDVIKEYYKYAKSKNLNLVTCIPTFLDSLDKSLLEDLIKDGCDYIQIMNYTKDLSITAIEKEVELAKKYNKPLETIAELQAPNTEKKVTDDITFYNDGLQACINKFNEIINSYDYSKLGYSFHHYTPVITLLQNIQDINSKYYDVELYPYASGVSVEIKHFYILDSNNKIRGIPSYASKSGEYLIELFALEYGKEYSLSVEEDGYTLNSNNQKLTYTYATGDKSIKYKSIKLEKTNESSTLSLELYGHVKSTNDEVQLLSGKLICGNEQISAQVVETKDKLKILYWPKLDYDKEYSIQLELENGYTIIENQTYKFTDRSKDRYYDDVYVLKN